MSFLFLFLFFFCIDTYAFFSTIPGENIWRMTSRIADCLDITASKVCVIADSSTRWTSTLEAIDKTVELIEVQVFGIGDEFTFFQDILCSKIMMIQDSSLDVVFTDINDFKMDLISVFDEITGDLSVLDVTVGSIFDNIITTIDSVGDSISSNMDVLSECALGFMIHQSDFNAGTFFINTPGTYTLCEDITTSFIPGIQIQSDDVVVDLNGHTIFYGVTGGCALSVVPSFTNILVKNGSVESTILSTTSCCIQIDQASAIYVDALYSVGLLLSILNSESIMVTNYIGIGPNSGISAQNSIDTIINQASITGDANIGTPSFGVLINSGNVAISKVIVSSADSGIQLDSIVNGLVQDCTVEIIGNFGYTILNVLTGSVVIDRSIAKSAFSGFLINSSTGSLLRDCIANECNTGIEVDASTNTVIKRASISNNNVGIFINPTSSNTYILDTCPVNNVTNLNDQGSNTVFINLETFTEILCSKIELFQNEAGSILDKEDLFLLSFSDVALTVTDTIDSLLECFLGTPIRQTDIPYSIPGPGIYTVCESLVYNGGLVGSAAITNTSNDVMINFNGYSITTDNRAIVSVTPGLSNIILKNGIITSGLEAVVIDFAQSVFLENIRVNRSANIALKISNSDCIFIKNSTVFGNNGAIIAGITVPGAFYFEECGSVVVQSCEASSASGLNLERGFSVNGIDALGGFVLQDCIVSRVNAEGIRIAETSGDLATVQLIHCTISDADDGVAVIHTSGSNAGPYIESCLVTACNRGFVINRTSGVLLHESLVTQTGAAGFLFASSTDEIAAIACVSQHNGNGFTIDGTRAVCDRSTATNNRTEGFLLSANAIGSILYGCLASRNNRGINDNNVAGFAIVDTRSQDAAFGINPAYNLNTNIDIKGGGAGSVIIRTS